VACRGTLQTILAYRMFSLLQRKNPFGGDSRPSRVSLWRCCLAGPSFPFPHPWNYHDPLRILEAFFWDCEGFSGAALHNRFLKVPGFPPVLVSRDPSVIRAVSGMTGDQPGEFDRDTMPTMGIAQATGTDTLLYSNGAVWRRQRKAAATPFGKNTLFQPERFREFEETFRRTAGLRIDAFQAHLRETCRSSATVKLAPEIQSVMLEMLANNFFGAELTYDEIRNRYVPAIERIIESIVRDTVMNHMSVPWLRRRTSARQGEDNAEFDRLTTIVLRGRADGRGLWGHFRSDAPDDALRNNLKVFLAGALEATTSFASWALSHLSRNHEIQERIYQEVRNIDEFTPPSLEQAPSLQSALQETLRLTPSLYFLPRRASAESTVPTVDGGQMTIPAGAHILLDIWHANRNNEFWGEAATGRHADEFAPERWGHPEVKSHPKRFLHFGFGYGSRVCPGMHLGLLETTLVVGAIVKQFALRAATPTTTPRAGVSTHPGDGVLVELRLRTAAASVR
jgi:cytochrome P450